MNKLHPIDRPEGKYSKLELDEMMVFCILDTAVSYEKVCETFDELKKHGMTCRSGLSAANIGSIYNVMKGCGYRWAHQKSMYLKKFGRNKINLTMTTREELVIGITGIGMKLASMFLRNTRGDEYAVLDVHTLRWLQKRAQIPDDEFKKMSYKKKEELFILAAELMGKTTTQLDLDIWNKYRVGNR